MHDTVNFDAPPTTINLDAPLADLSACTPACRYLAAHEHCVVDGCMLWATPTHELYAADGSDGVECTACRRAFNIRCCPRRPDGAWLCPDCAADAVATV